LIVYIDMCDLNVADNVSYTKTTNFWLSQLYGFFFLQILFT